MNLSGVAFLKTPARIVTGFILPCPRYLAPQSCPLNGNTSSGTRVNISCIRSRTLPGSNAWKATDWCPWSGKREVIVAPRLGRAADGTAEGAT